ncbi:MAG: metallophosphoesterase family protein [Candidatus Eisenbacteria bacterium]
MRAGKTGCGSRPTFAACRPHILRGPAVVSAWLILIVGVLGARGAQPAASSTLAASVALDPHPRPIPDRIILTWQADPEAIPAVTWRTDGSVMHAWAEIAPVTGRDDEIPLGSTGSTTPPTEPAARDSAGLRRLPARTEFLRTEQGAAHYHSVVFGGLEPGGRYRYRVGSDQGSSAWLSLRTPAESDSSYRFIYLGDAQTDILVSWGPLLQAAVAAAPDARFILHAGDLVDDGRDDALWAEWFAAGAAIHATIPTLPAIGNHEYARRREAPALPPYWQPHFTLPENGAAGLEETNYYVDHQGVRVIVLDSNRRLEEQALWLARVLADNPNRWTIACFHHPIFSATARRDNPELRALWKPLFDEYAVDLVLQGHDHVYARGRAFVSGADPGTEEQTPAPGSERRTERPVYVISVSGSKMYALEEQPWMERAGENIQLYQIIRVEADHLRYEAYTLAGELFDSFDLAR